jgi:hypothetical protein
VGGGEDGQGVVVVKVAGTVGELRRALEDLRVVVEQWDSHVEWCGRAAVDGDLRCRDVAPGPAFVIVAEEA